MIELACKEVDFHFNKKHLEDPEIPMWVIRTKGKSYYVNHVTSTVSWSTKESVDNPKTKGSIKFKNVLLKIDDENCAELSVLTSVMAARLRALANGYTRVLITAKDQFVKFLKDHSIAFTPFKTVYGSCGSTFWVCDIKKLEDVTMLKLGLSNGYRILQENEIYYKAYDDPEILKNLDADDYYSESDEDNEDNDTHEIKLEDLYTS